MKILVAVLCFLSVAVFVYYLTLEVVLPRIWKRPLNRGGGDNTPPPRKINTVMVMGKKRSATKVVRLGRDNNEDKND